MVSVPGESEEPQYLEASRKVFMNAAKQKNCINEVYERK